MPRQRLESPDDSLLRFIFEHFAVRGEHVSLDASWRDQLARAGYPPTVRGVLGESLAAVALLAGGLKLRGSVTVQAQGDGPVSLLVVQCNSSSEVRGMARWHDPLPEGADASELLGGGRLVITLDPDGSGRRYQGIVPLEGGDLARIFERYFAQSEQLETRFWLSADEHRAAGLMLQQLPGATGGATLEEHWGRVQMLTDTLTSRELATLSAGDLLHRLYHEEEVRVFKPRPMRFHCRCSRARIEEVLRSMGRELLDDCREEDGAVAVDCEFCGQAYRFDRVDLEQLFSRAVGAPGSPRRH